MFDEGWALVLVQKVIMPTTEAESWTVTDDNLEPVQPAEEYLAYLSAIERSPTTVRAYAHSLKLWFEFVTGRELAWDQVSVDTVARFVAWLRAPADTVVVLDAGSAVRAPATVGWRGGTSPPRSRQTDREPLDSIGFLPRLARIRLLSVARLAKRSSTKVRAFAPGLLPPLLHYYTLIRPSASHPVLSPSAFGLDVLPFPPFLVGPRHDWFPSSVQEPARRSCPLYAGHRLAKNETTRQAYPRAVHRPQF